VTTAFAAVMTRTAVLDRTSTGNHDASESKRREEKRDDLNTKPGTDRNMTVSDQQRWASSHSPDIAQGPPWATCYVEQEEEGRPVLEEWVMRGEGENLNAFRSWAKRGLEPVSVRCEESSMKADDDVMCIECMSHSGSELGERGAAVTVVQAQLVTTFVDLQQCLASTVGGNNFCKSGRVVVPM